MFKLVSAIVVTSFVFSANAELQTYKLDPYHTNVVWHANHFGFSNPSGKFTDVSGAVNFDEMSPKNTSVHVEINTKNIITGIEKFDEHLKGKDFFNVSEFPKASFISTKVESINQKTKTAKVHGVLTLLGVEKPVIMTVKFNRKAENPFSKKETIGFSGKTVIKRSDFGMSYAIPGVSDEVAIEIESEAFVE